MTIAPSEKHLEDWIVANPTLIHPEYWIKSPSTGAYPFIDHVIARQPRFPNGRPDLIARTGTGLNICVLELKKGDIDPATVAQCIRYTYDLSGIFTGIHFDHYNHPDYTYEHTSLWTIVPGGEIIGAVIGHAMPDENLKIVCELLGVSIFVYDFDGSNYTFQLLPHHRDNDSATDAIIDWRQGALGVAMKDVMRERCKYEQYIKAEREKANQS